MIHMGKQLERQLEERKITRYAFRKIVTPHLPRFKGTGRTCSKQWVYQICQAPMWQPKTLEAVSAALKVEPAVFVQPLAKPPAKKPPKTKVA